MKRRVKYGMGITVRFPDDVLEAVRRLAQQNDRSFNWQVVTLLRHALVLPEQKALYERENEHPGTI